MAPACILSSAPRSFAIPLSDSTPHRDVRAYAAPLRELEALARHLVGAAYGGTQQLEGAAIVEEPMEGATIWWLVLTRSCETRRLTSSSGSVSGCRPNPAWTLSKYRR